MDECREGYRSTQQHIRRETEKQSEGYGVT